MPSTTAKRGASLGLALPLVLFAAWWFATTYGGVKLYQLASPAQVASELVALAAAGELWKNLWASVERVALGFAIALALAVAAGSAVGLSSRVERIVDPTLQALRAIPSLAWVPLLLLWLGIGESAKIVLISIGAFFPIYVNLVAGIRGVDRKLVEVANVFGIRGFALARRVVLPAASPSLLVGARIGLTQAWLFPRRRGIARCDARPRFSAHRRSANFAHGRSGSPQYCCSRFAASSPRASCVGSKKRALHWTDGIAA